MTDRMYRAIRNLRLLGWRVYREGVGLHRVLRRGSEEWETMKSSEVERVWYIEERGRLLGELLSRTVR